MSQWHRFYNNVEGYYRCDLEIIQRLVFLWVQAKLNLEDVRVGDSTGCSENRIIMKFEQGENNASRHRSLIVKYLLKFSPEVTISLSETRGFHLHATTSLSTY